MPTIPPEPQTPPIRVGVREPPSRALSALICRLCTARADAEKREDSGATPLVRAARYGHLDILELLLVHKADVLSRDLHGGTALHWAARFGHTACCGRLVDAGGALDGLDTLGGPSTPLMWAARYEQRESAYS